MQVTGKAIARIASAIMLVVFSGVQPASASTIISNGEASSVGSSGSIQKNTFSVNLSNQTSYYSGLITESGSYFYAPKGYMATGNSSTQMSEANGVLSGLTTADGQFAFTSPPNGVIALTDADGVGYINWMDTFTVTSSTLSTGTAITVQVENYLNSTVSLTGCGSCSPYENAYAQSDLQIKNFNFGIHSLLTNRWQDPSSTLTDILLVTLNVGATYTLERQLSLAANANDGYDYSTTEPGRTVSAVAGGTARTFIDVLTPGAAISTSSGFNYSATPEPSTWLICLSAVFFVVARCRRLKQTNARHPSHDGSQSRNINIWRSRTGLRTHGSRLSGAYHQRANVPAKGNIMGLPWTEDHSSSIPR